MLRNRGSRFDTGWLVTFSVFFILVEKNLLRNFLSVAKMASLVYERENCPVDTAPEEFENGRFTPKPHQMFSVDTTPEEFKNATITVHFGFVFEDILVREITGLP